MFRVWGDIRNLHIYLQVAKTFLKLRKPYRNGEAFWYWGEKNKNREISRSFRSMLDVAATLWKGSFKRKFPHVMMSLVGSSRNEPNAGNKTMNKCTEMEMSCWSSSTASKWHCRFSVVAGAATLLNPQLKACGYKFTLNIKGSLTRVWCEQSWCKWWAADKACRLVLIFSPKSPP